MAFSKVVEGRLFGITTQFTDTRMPVGDSASGTHTKIVNPFRGTLLWDDMFYVLHGVSVGGGATGGSFTVTIQTDAVKGYTGLPIAIAVLGPLSKTTVVMDNMHGSPGSPLPTHCFIDQGVASAGATQAVQFQCYAMAKQYRGTLGTPGMNTSERIIQGNLVRGDSSGKYFGTTDDTGVSVDATFTLGTSGSDMGMRRIRQWDRAFYWQVSHGAVAGTWDFDVFGYFAGATFSIATTGTTGNMATAGQKLPIRSNIGGQSPNPYQVCWTEVTAGGVSTCRTVVLAKTGRGSQAKS